MLRQDLNAAREFYDNRLRAAAMALRYTALGDRFREAVAAGELAYLAPRLGAVRKDAALDLLCVTDATGRVIHRSHGPPLTGDSLTADPLVRRVLAGENGAAGTVRIPIEALTREAPALARRARLRVVPTPRAMPSQREELDSAMMLCAFLGT